ncbi:MAG: twin arginine-targeting protein translocase TatC [Spirochaetes bacterium GWF1_51_8]|nr:MAG: twin arginine-targeting protein translocase TatC [Spirochaetes bacterium GWF1_51_8]
MSGSPIVKDLPFVEHLEILRRKLIWIIAVMLIAGIAVFFFADKLLVLMQEPMKKLAVDLIYLKPQEKFFTYIKLSFFAGLIIGFPFALVILGSFVYPALKRSERKYFYIASVFMPVFFFGGCLLSYLFFAPWVFEFLILFGGGDNIKALWSIGEYINLLMTVVVMIGIVFEVPWVLFFLIKFGVISVDTLAKHRRIIIVAIFIIAAVITPPDAVSQVIVGGTMYILFELTLLFARIGMKKAKKADGEDNEEETPPDDRGGKKKD